MNMNAALYISDPAMVGSRLFDRSPDILSYEAFGNETPERGFKLRLEWGEIVCKMMRAESMARHLRGLEDHMQGKFISADDSIYFSNRLRYVRTCLGLQISHKDDAENEVHQFLFSMNEVLAGLLYMHDTVWDWSREALVGALKD